MFMRKYFVSLFILNLLRKRECAKNNEPMACEGPDCFASTSEMIIHRGYPGEKHRVITSDGYILQLDRIPFGKTPEGDQSIKDKPAVLLCHGIFSSSATWVINPPYVSLGYILADAGFDVWLGNYRGTPGSLRHQKYTSEDPEFWKFPFDKLVLEDNPAFIDYVLERTKQSQIFYIGHSQATASLLGLLAYKTEYNAKIKEAYLMCPIILLTGGFGGTIPFFLKPFVNRGSQLAFLEDFGDNPAVFPTPRSYYEMKDDFCETNWMVGYVCAFVEPNYQNKPGIIQDRVPVYNTVFPTGTSAYVMVQGMQVLYHDRLQCYNYGTEENLKHYGQTDPPEYKIQQISAPIFLLSSKDDTVASPPMVDYIRKHVKSISGDYVVQPPPNQQFDHGDFTLSKYAPELVYSKIIEQMKKRK